jgi:hypothetical protein
MDDGSEYAGRWHDRGTEHRQPRCPCQLLTKSPVAVRGDFGDDIAWTEPQHDVVGRPQRHDVTNGQSRLASRSDHRINDIHRHSLVTSADVNLGPAVEDAASRDIRNQLSDGRRSLSITCRSC